MGKISGQDFAGITMVLLFSSFSWSTIITKNESIYTDTCKVFRWNAYSLGHIIYKIFVYYFVRAFFIIIPFTSLTYIIKILFHLSFSWLSFQGVVLVGSIPYMVLGLGGMVGSFRNMFKKPPYVLGKNTLSKDEQKQINFLITVAQAVIIIVFLISLLKYPFKTEPIWPLLLFVVLIVMSCVGLLNPLEKPFYEAFLKKDTYFVDIYSLKNNNMHLFYKELDKHLLNDDYSVEKGIEDKYSSFNVIAYIGKKRRKISCIAFIEFSPKNKNEKLSLESFQPVREKILSLAGKRTTIIYCFVADNILPEVYEQLTVKWQRSLQQIELPLFIDLASKNVYFPARKNDIVKDSFRSVVVEFIEKFPNFFELQQ